MKMPIYRVLWPVYHNGKRHMPNEALDLPQAAGKRLAEFRAVVDPDAPPSNPTPPSTPQQPSEPPPRSVATGAKAVAQPKTETKQKK